MKTKKFLSLVLSAAMILGVAVPVAAEPVSAGQGVEAEQQPIVENSITSGYILSDLDYNTPVYEPDEAVPYSDDWGYSADETIENKYPANGVSDIKAKYPSVRNQNPLGTCWAFSSIGLAEFDLINDGAFDKNIDLSELHLAYYAYNSLLDPLGGTVGDYAKYYMNNTSVQYGYLNRGGNYLMAARRMGQWCGPVSESDVPYSKVASNGYTASTIDTFLNTGLSDEYAYSKDKAHLENTYMINIKENASDVKKAIKKYGAVGIMYSHNDTGYHYINNSYNDKTNNRAGHAVMVVGWDDNYSKDNFRDGVKPEKDGAWLIRNSWGDGTGSYYNQSYFWMSYETFSLSDTAWVFDFSANDGYDNNYQVDGGLNVAHQSGYRKLANVFTTQTKQGVSSEDLKAVSLSITSKTNVNYTIEIYTDLKDKTKPTSGTKQETATTTGQTTYAGVYTIPLKAAVNLKPGTSYSVVVTTDTPAIDIEAAMTGDVNYNNEMVWENHVSSDNTASYYFYGTGLAYSRNWNYQNVYGNFCIKAFTANNVEKDSDKLVGRSLTLKDNIDMNYYMELPESIKSNSNAYMEFTVNNSQPYKVSVNDAIPVEKNGKVIYKFACPLNAAQMSDTVKAKMVVDGNSGNEYTYSVKEYATELLSKSNEYPEETIKLVKALLNYGTAAQSFFKYNTDKPANAILSDTDKIVAAADFAAYKAVIKTDSANSQSNGLTYYGSSLICKSEMTVRHYFMVNEGCDINNYKFSYVNADGNEVSLTPKKASDGVYCVDINGIMARNLNCNYACIVSAQVIMKPNCVLGLATGSTPIGLYKQLVEWFKKGDLDFSEVMTVNLDEYKGLSRENDQSYYYFMHQNLFDHVNIPVENTHLPNGMEPDSQKECKRYTELIQSLGGVDLQLLGIGHNGHIGFNEPGESFDKQVHCVNLTESTIEANKRFFASADDVPKQAYTMGIKTIMQAKKILIVASGEDKAEIVHKAFFGPITPQVPASVLQLHNDVTLVADEAALSCL